MSVLAIKQKLEELSATMRAAINDYTTEQEYQDWARIHIKEIRAACDLNEPQDEESKDESQESQIITMLKEHCKISKEIECEVTSQLDFNK